MISTCRCATEACATRSSSQHRRGLLRRARAVRGADRRGGWLAPRCGSAATLPSPLNAKLAATFRPRVQSRKRPRIQDFPAAQVACRGTGERSRMRTRKGFATQVGHRGGVLPLSQPCALARHPRISQRPRRLPSSSRVPRRSLAQHDLKTLLRWAGTRSRSVPFAAELQRRNPAVHVFHFDVGALRAKDPVAVRFEVVHIGGRSGSPRQVWTVPFAQRFSVPPADRAGAAFHACTSFHLHSLDAAFLDTL